MPTAVRAFFALVWFSVRRQGRVRQVGWVGFALFAVTLVVVAAVTHAGNGWRMDGEERWVLQFKMGVPDKVARPVLALHGPAAFALFEHEARANDELRDAIREETPNRRPMTYPQYMSERLSIYQSLPGPPEQFAIMSAVFAAARGPLADERFQNDWAFANYTQHVVLRLFIGFLLPLFTLAYATGAIGAEREGRTLLWLTTRPLPGWAVYLAKLAGGLPWCVGVCGGAFAILCLCSGELGRRALAEFWPAVLAGAVAFGCLFHLVGAVFRRPTIVGLVYVFFFETLVAELPGGLKQFSLNYYLTSLFYNRLSAVTPTVRPVGIDAYQPADPDTAWVVLLVAAAAVSALGAWLFGRLEAKEET
jgi:ABC-2 type transport system permease protein